MGTRPKTGRWIACYLCGKQVYRRPCEIKEGSLVFCGWICSNKGKGPQISKAVRGRKKGPQSSEWLQHRIDGIKAYYAAHPRIGKPRSTESNGRTRQSMQAFFANNPEAKQRHIERLHQPEVEAKVTAAVLKRWSDPAFKERMRARFKNRKPSLTRNESIREAWANPELRRRQSEQRRNLTNETRAKLRQAQRRIWAANPARRERMGEASARRIASGHGPWRATTIERILWQLLESAGFVIEKQVQFGRACVDVYIRELHLAFEADGIYWHNRPGMPERDRLRDEGLLERFNLPVVRLTEPELRAIGRQLT